jgi:uncharacterized protein YuzE
VNVCYAGDANGSASDAQADAAYLKRLDGVPGGSSDQRSIAVADRGEIVPDFNLEGHLVGIEVIGARELLPPELLGSCEPGV